MLLLNQGKYPITEYYPITCVVFQTTFLTKKGENLTEKGKDHIKKENYALKVVPERLRAEMGKLKEVQETLLESKLVSRQGLRD